MKSRPFHPGLVLGLAALSGAFITLHAGFSLTVLSTNSPAVGPAGTGNGLTALPFFSADGRWLVFASTSGNLVATNRQHPWFEVFRRNLTTGATEALTPGSDAGSTPLGVSADGGTVLVLSSSRTLTTNDPGGADLEPQLYLISPGQSTPVLVSAGAAGALGDAATVDAVMTPDGRRVAFESGAGNLVAGDTNNATDLFLYDAPTGTRRLITRQPLADRWDGPSLIGLSEDGRFLAYRLPILLPPPATNLLRETDVVIVDLTDGTERRLTAPGPVTVDRLTIPTVTAAFSRDGRMVTARIGGIPGFRGVGPSKVEVGGVIWWDLPADTQAVVYAKAPTREEFRLGDGLAGPSFGLESDTVLLNYLDPAVTNGPVRLGVWRPETGLRSLTDLVQTVPPAGPPAEPVDPEDAQFTPDGRAVIFSAAVGTNVTSSRTLYRRELATGRTEVLPRDTAGAPVRVTLAYPEQSPDGRLLAFVAESPTVVANDLNNSPDLFLVDLADGRVAAAATPGPGSPGVFGDGLSTLTPNSISADGRRVVFRSMVTTLTTNLGNRQTDVFLHDRATGANTLVSVGTNGVSKGDSGGGIISADGSTVVFWSYSAGLTAGTNGDFAQLYHRDLASGVTRKITRQAGSDNGAARGGEDPVVSADGRYVAFVSFSSDLVSPPPVIRSRGVYVFDARTGTNRLLRTTTSFLPLGMPLMSADGLTVAVVDSGPGTNRFFVYSGGETYPVVTGVPGAPGVPGTLVAALSPDGRLIASASQREVLVAQVGAAAAPSLLYRKTNSTGFSDLRFTGDGRNVLISGQFRTTNFTFAREVVLAPVAGGDPEVVSQPDDVAAEDTNARQPSVSADGRYVAFVSNATNLVPGPTPVSHIFVRDRQSGRTYVADPGATFAGGLPQLSADGRTLVFLTRAGLLPEDDNRQHDIYHAVLTDEPVPDDADGDGLPDVWERKYFHSLRYGREDDRDGDGVSNLAEFRAGTSPIRPPAAYHLTQMARGTNAVWRLSLTPAFTTVLQVYRRPDLLTRWSAVGGTLIGAGTAFSADYLSEIDPDAESGFLRFDLEQ